MRRALSPQKSLRMVVLAMTCLSLTWSNPATSEEAQEGGVGNVVPEEGADVPPDEPVFPLPPMRTAPTQSSHGHPTIPEGGNPSLDALLHLPSNFVGEEPRAVAGAGESVWRHRFEKADRELAEARVQLSATKKELEGVALSGGGSQWSIAAPGGGNNNTSPTTTSPLSFRLRQKLRGDRERLTETEKARRELQIEADLAGVPQRWRVGSGTAAGHRQN